MQIREANDYEKEQLVELVKRIEDDSKKEEVLKTIDAELQEGELKTFVAVNQDQILSYGIFNKQDDETGEIVFVGTDAYFRNNGYGAEVVNHIESYAKERMLKKLFLKASAKNKKSLCFWIENEYEFQSRSEKSGLDYYLGKCL